MASSKAAVEPPGGGAARRPRPGVEGRRPGGRARLHGFSLEDLSWGNQKLLRCVKVPPEAGPAGRRAHDRRKRRAVGGDEDGEEEEEEEEMELREIRDKLMAHYKAAVDNIQRAAVKKDRRHESAPAAAAAAGGVGDNDEKDFGDATAAAATSRPWNLRTRRSACSAPPESWPQRRSPNAAAPGSGAAAAEKGRYVGSVPEPKTAADSLVAAGGRAKLSLTLTKEEIAEDYRLMSEGCPTKRPKRRSQKLQRVLEKLVPGMWLSEITADDYKVPGEK